MLLQLFVTICYHLHVFHSSYSQKIFSHKLKISKTVSEHYAHNQKLRFLTKKVIFIFQFWTKKSCPISKFWKKFVKKWKNRCEHHAHSADSVFSVLLLRNVIHSQFLFSNFDEERVANTKNEKRNWLWKTLQKSTVSIMLRNHFFADFFCYWEFVIHSQFLFSNFDEERVANMKNEKCNWLWITNWPFLAIQKGSYWDC